MGSDNGQIAMLMERQTLYIMLMKMDGIYMRLRMCGFVQNIARHGHNIRCAPHIAFPLRDARRGAATPIAGAHVVKAPNASG